MIISKVLVLSKDTRSDFEGKTITNAIALQADKQGSKSQGSCVVWVWGAVTMGEMAKVI